MSGGYFEYNQFKLYEMAEDIQKVIDENNNDDVDECGDTIGRQYSPETIDKLNEAVHAIRVAFVYAQRADWLLSDDDGECSFITRLADGLKEIEK